MTIENLSETFNNCRYCLMCRHVAPVELVTHLETLSPHGIALMAASVERGLMEWDPGAVQVIYSEPDGGNCRMHCVTDQPLPAATAQLRAELVDSGFAPAVVNDLKVKYQNWSNPFSEKVPNESNTNGKTAVFVGDESRFFNERSLDSCLKLLSAIGETPVQIGDGRSSGFMANSLGLQEEAVNLAKANLQELENSGAEKLIVLTPGDMFAFRQVYPERLGLAVQESTAIVEAVELLNESCQSGKLKFQNLKKLENYAYVDPTHAVRVPERHKHPRQLLLSATGEEPIELFWREDRAHPAGTTQLRFTRPEIAEKLTRSRLADASKAGAKIVITEDPATFEQLKLYADEYELQVVGMYELLADCL